MTLILGADEAGRGPVIGPLVIAAIVIDESDTQKLKELDVKDSKLLTPKKRSELFPKIKKIAKKFKILKIEPKEIDSFLEADHLNLNWLEARKTADIINELKPDKAFIDCPSPNKTAYANYIKRFLTVNTELIVDHKAESKFLTVAAASILAKVTRDAEIKELEKKYGTKIASLPYKESVWVEKDNFIFTKNIGEIVENTRSDLNIFSLNKLNLELKNHKITFGFNHNKMDIYKVYFNNGMELELSANHPLFILSDNGNLTSKPIYKLESGENVAFTFLNKKRKIIKSLNFLNLLKPYSTNKNPLYIKSSKIKSLIKNIDRTKWKDIALKNGYNRTALYPWIKHSVLPLHLVDEMILNNHNIKCKIVTREGNAIPSNFIITKDFCWFLGIYLAEGCITGNYKAGIYNKDKKIIKRIVNFLERYNFGFCKSRDGIQIGSVLFNKMIKSLNLGANAYNKNVPSVFYNLSKNNIKSLLQGIYDGDGYKDENSQEIEIYSKELRDSIVNLELIIGNICSLRYRKKRGSYIARRLSISTNALSIDNIPSNVGIYIKKLRENRKLKLREVESKYNISRGVLGYIEKQKVKKVSKKTLKRINRIFKDKKLNRLINSNLFWLKIVKILPKKSKEMVYDLEVRPNFLQNFVGSSGIILHNSGYQHDPITQQFIKENWEKHPEIFRKSWSTWKNQDSTKKQKKLDEF